MRFLFYKQKIFLLLSLMFLPFLTEFQLGVPLSLADPHPLSSDDRSALRQLGQRFQSYGFGVLLTPPFGTQNSPHQRARRYLQQVFDDVAGDLTRNLNVQVRINIYSSVVSNACISNPQAVNSMTAHRFLGFSNTGVPAFEIGISVELLNLLQNEDELAFLLLHEFGHFAKGHVKGPGTYTLENWLDNQANEIEADLYAIDHMVGRFNLDSSHELMARILRDQPPASPSAALAASHHHPSLRLGSLISRAEYHRRRMAEASLETYRTLGFDFEPLLSSPRDQRQRFPVLTTVDEAFINAYESWWQSFVNPTEPTEPVHSHDYRGNFFQSISPLNQRMGRSGSSANGRIIITHAEWNRILDLSLNVLQTATIMTDLTKLERLFEFSILTQNNIVLGDPSNSREVQNPFSTFSEAQRRKLERAFLTWSRPTNPRRSNFEETWLQLFNHELNTRVAPVEHSRHPPQSSIHQLLVSLIKIFPLLRFSTQSHTSHLAPLLMGLLSQSFQTDPWESFNFIFENQDKLPHWFFMEGLHQVNTEILARILEEPGRVPAIFSRLQNLEALEDPTLRNQVVAFVQQHWVSVFQAHIRNILQTLDPNRPHLFLEAQEDLNQLIAQQPLRSFEFLSIDVSTLSEQDLEKIWQTFHQEDHLIISAHLLAKIAFILASKAHLRGDLDEAWQWYCSSLELEIFEANQLNTSWVHEMGQENLERSFRPDSEILNWLQEVQGEIELANRTLDSIEREFLRAQENRERRSFDALNERIRRDRWPTLFDLTYRRINNLALSPEIQQRVLGPMPHEDFTQLIEIRTKLTLSSIYLEATNHLASFDHYHPPRSFSESDRAFFNELIRRQNQEGPSGLTFEPWLRTVLNLIRGPNITIDTVPLEIREPLAAYFRTHWLHLSDHQYRKSIFKNPEILKLLPAEHLAEYLETIYLQDIGVHDAHDHLTASTSPEELERRGRTFRAMIDDFNLQRNYPRLHRILEMRVAESLRLQPHEIDTFFGPENQLRRPQEYAHEIRGFSGVLAWIQRRTHQEQIEFLDYVMGRQNIAPHFISEIDQQIRRDHNTQFSFQSIVLNMRALLTSETDFNRSLILVPFFTGPNSLSGTSTARESVLNYILQNVSTERLTLARELAEGIMTGEGHNLPLALAFIFGQRPQDGSSRLTEGDILKALFQGYGVPGTKLGQYLAFTSEFQTIRDLLGELQDRAMPISYLEVIKLFSKRFPAGLPNGLRILDIRGSGAVNIAVAIWNPQTNQREIITIPRESIQVSSEQDFRRIQRVVTALTRTPDGQRKYGYLRGLLGIIHRSVTLEFDRPRVFQAQSDLHETLAQTIDGWQIRFVAPYALENGTIRMEQAHGVSARILENQNPELYRQAMAAASKAILGHLLRWDVAPVTTLRTSWQRLTDQARTLARRVGLARESSTEAPTTVPTNTSQTYYADSDFHNGQVFVDQNTNSIYLLDPGQAITIHREEFLLGKLLLRVLLGFMDFETAREALNQSVIFRAHRSATLLSHQDMVVALHDREPADAFIQLLGRIGLNGGEVPLATVQWVLGAQRQLVLGERLGLQPARLGITAALFVDTAADFLEDPALCGRQLMRRLRPTASSN